MGQSAAGDTWGLSGPAFLLLYGLLAAIVCAAWLGARRRVRAAGPARPPRIELADRPHEVAFLNGGAALAVFAALSAMRLQGWVSLSRGTVQATGRLGPGASELERAIHGAAGRPLHRKSVPVQPAVRAALDGTAQRLVKAGLLLPDAARRQLRGIAYWLGPLAVLGGFRLVAGVQRDRPVGFLVLELVAVLVAMAVLVARVPRRTERGDQVLADLRSRQHDLDPRNRPDWAVYGPAGAALGVGLYGVGALWASDPALASELALQRTAGAGGFTGDAGGGDGGGGGGCGGGGCGG